MDVIKTATGKEFKTDYYSAIPHPAQCFFRLTDTTFATAAAVFSNPKETVQLWMGNTYLAHYTNLIAISNEDGAIRVSMGKE